ncbi:hypothetical protein C8Q80DRAFT_1172451 [Daedaleopsis nitida]|nr:hypothetical protein C8Q80DRAFT_1172451 [Daedaleopsis nitida]
MSLILHAPRPRRHDAHSGSVLEWDVASMSELAKVALQITTPDVVIKPRELHLAFNWGNLRSKHYSRFRQLKLPPARPRYTGKMAAVSRSSTVSSVMSVTKTVIADVGILVTRLIRRETTYIVWGAIMAVDSPTSTVPPRNVTVKIAVDEEGGEDLREDARLHQQLVERGLAVGYYGIFTDSIGSTALVIDDFDGELQVDIPTS